jgi:hypothetical protein
MLLLLLAFGVQVDVVQAQITFEESVRHHVQRFFDFDADSLAEYKARRIFAASELGNLYGYLMLPSGTQIVVLRADAEQLRISGTFVRLTSTHRVITGVVNGYSEPSLDSFPSKFRLFLKDSEVSLILDGTDGVFRQHRQWWWIQTGIIRSSDSSISGNFLFTQRQLPDEPTHEETFVEYISPFRARFAGWVEQDSVANLVSDDSEVRIQVVLHSYPDDWKVAPYDVVMANRRLKYLGAILKAETTSLFKQETVTGQVTDPASGHPAGILRLVRQYWR